MKQARCEKTQLRKLLRRLVVVIVLGVAFAYIEAAVVVYLRHIFHPDGFTFPLVNIPVTGIWGKLLAVELGREAATLVLIAAACLLAGNNNRQRFAYYLIIFSTWDIFYYIWLKVLIGWPDSITDWDILFLIPMVWAGPVLAPLIVSATLIVFAVISLMTEHQFRWQVNLYDWMGFVLTALFVVILFCRAGLYCNRSDYEQYFSWPLFIIAELIGITIFAHCLLRSKHASMPDNQSPSATR